MGVQQTPARAAAAGQPGTPRRYGGAIRHTGRAACAVGWLRSQFVGPSFFSCTKKYHFVRVPPWFWQSRHQTGPHASPTGPGGRLVFSCAGLTGPPTLGCPIDELAQLLGIWYILGGGHSVAWALQAHCGVKKTFSAGPCRTEGAANLKQSGQFS